MNISTASSEQNTPTPTISITSNKDSVEISKAVRDEVLAKANEYISKFYGYIFGGIIGILATIVWDLNGQIYKAVGETGVNAVSTKILEIEINRLKEEINKLERQSNINDCLENKKVTNKAGCYHGG